ncbi:MAG: four helix bundle protein [Crocinitomicaceae bacterium]|nr:four helix bundle protein [Crocinitomicaceae bacterium]
MKIGEGELIAEESISKYVNLENRTRGFAKNVRKIVQKLKKDISNMEDCKQVVRASGSIGANYIEANENFSKADFAYRIHICRKEAKETCYWLELLKENNIPHYQSDFENLIEEGLAIQRIFGTIHQKVNTIKQA